MTTLTVPGAVYGACFAEVEPASVTPVLKGFRATLEGSREQVEEWIDHMIDVAADLAWDSENTGLVEAIYKSVERNDRALGRTAVS